MDGVDEGDNDPSNTGDPELWDPNMGSKLSPQDNWGPDSEVEVEEVLSYGGAREMNSAMIDMIIELGDFDEHDGKWLLVKERLRLEAKKKGIVSFQVMNSKSTHHGDQERERPITMGPILQGSREKHNNAPTTSTR